LLDVLWASDAADLEFGNPPGRVPVALLCGLSTSVMNSRRFIAGYAPDTLRPSVSDSSAHVQAVACPVRVKRVVLTAHPSLPVYPDNRTISEPVGTSQKCQYQK
jgi:hypothetical protein